MIQEHSHAEGPRSDARAQWDPGDFSERADTLSAQTRVGIAAESNSSDCPTEIQAYWPC